MDNDIVGQGIAGGVNNFFRMQNTLRNQNRQENLDAVNLRRLALDEQVKNATLADQSAQQGGMLQAYGGGGNLQTAYANKIKAEKSAKETQDFFNNIGDLKKAGASPDFITKFAKSKLAANPQTAPMADSISFIDDQAIKLVRDIGENQMPDPTQPGKFIPAGKYEVEGKATGDPANPYKFTTIKPFADKATTWEEPYETSIGGKKALVQKSSKGEVRPVIQDKNATGNEIPPKQAQRDLKSAYKEYVTARQKWRNNRDEESTRFMNEKYDEYVALGDSMGRDVRGKYAPLKAAASSPATGKTITRTGIDKKTGRKVVQYSDGTIDYAP